MAAEKTTEIRSAVTRGGVRFNSYEIHMGATRRDDNVEPFARLDDGRVDGACADRVIGTYLHGALESAEVCAELFNVPVPALRPKHQQYERLADWFAEHGRGLSQLGVI
jgi:cobyric acid synthase